MPKNKNIPSILETNILFLFIALSLTTLGAFAQYKNIYIGLLITEYIIILMPIVLYLKFNNYSINYVLRLNKINLKQILLTILIVLFSYPVAVFFNFIGITLLSRFIEIQPTPLPLPSNLKEYVLSFLIISLTPGICEETMFRGLIMSSYDRLGKKKAIIYSAILFGLFHFNVQNLLGPIYLGILFGTIAYKTNSIYATMIGHTVNNTIALTIGYIATKTEQLVGLSMENVDLPEMEQMIIAILGLGIFVLVFGFISFKLIKLLPTGEKKEVLELNTFIQGEYLTRELYKKDGMNMMEVFPIFIIVVIFILWNYKLLFI
ncbi:hypothetical protein EDD65_103197 [Keratinibaculum paraultunense]|uniref:CAAX prenyl protease 2/Lysostaphin resistance protein A-like domain-containing protein n=1 Tax=Keratinibaculum paraultunense TaxID=1278232 RepID=A0A4R3L1J1_9FIRM|nr:type II CAAX endopeptidase family protein [Keratinibaculum paraultunense]QQY80358.1 CPBP family intramembrane metalloprotease [Keratinibaculum paraultunense]TCS90883.1 hypothetical protein EDD65_103197 [Keratinibaculum paraultunense]